MNNIFNNNDCKINNYNNRLPLIVGGYDTYQTKFISMNCNESNGIIKFDKNSINIMNKKHLINNDIAVENVDLSRAGHSLLSFFISNHIEYGNCIILINTSDFHCDTGYNIYLINNDKWLFNKMKFGDLFDVTPHSGTVSPALLFNNS